MLRLFNILAPRVNRSLQVTRCFAMESQTNFDDLDREKKIKILELEISMLQQDGRRAPELDFLRPDHWDHILDLPTKSARRRYYQFLWQNEAKDANKLAIKERKKAENEIRMQQEKEEEANNIHINYGLMRNTMFLRIYDATITHFNNIKLIKSMMFEQKLVIDCSYDEFMNPREAGNAGKQLMLCFAENRLHDEPFDLHFCNVDSRSKCIKTLEKYVPTMYEKAFPLHLHAESLTETFDKDRLVYLTPHCNNDLEEYNHDDIYIIGGMVDKTNNDPLSLAKAKKQGLRMARLPLDRYLNWGAGSGKSLTLNQMVNIMLEMKKHGDWVKALRFVPKRKLVDNPQDFSQQPRRFTYEKSRNYQNSRSNNDYRHQSQSENFDDRRQDGNQRRNYDDGQQDNSFQFPRKDFGERRPYKPFDNNRRNFDDQRQESSFQNRRNYDDRRGDDRRQDNSFQNIRRNYDDRRGDDRRQDNSFQNSRRSYDDRREDNSFDSRRNSDERPRVSKERKHFDKFKFDLDSWGSKMNDGNKKNSSDS